MRTISGKFCEDEDVRKLSKDEDEKMSSEGEDEKDVYM